MRLLRFLIGLLLIPVCVAVSRAVFGLVVSLGPGDGPGFPAPALALGGGFGMWLLVFLTLPRPVRTYVAAHELTHALWGWAMGARVMGIRVGKHSGSVTLSESNFLVTLAPYFFPLYTILLIVVYCVLSLFYPMERYYLVWLALVGFTWAFHVTFTVTTLLQKQSDIRQCGHLFSYGVIYLLNVIGVGLWVVAVSSATVDGFASHMGKSLQFVWSGVWAGFAAFGRWARQYSSG